MYQTSRELKQRAKAVMHRRLFALMMTAALLLVASYLISYLSNELSGVNAWNREFSRRLDAELSRIQITDSMTYEEMMGVIASVQMPPIEQYYKGNFALLLSALVYMMSIPLSTGYSWHALMESRGLITRITSITYGFRFTFKTIRLAIARDLMVLLGTILFVVPGIILTFRYSMAVNVLVDDPSKGVIQCLKESAKLMKGSKWRLFKVELSFIGWQIVANLFTAFIGAPIFNIWLMPYMSLTEACFYNELLGRKDYNWSAEAETDSMNYFGSDKNDDDDDDDDDE